MWQGQKRKRLICIILVNFINLFTLCIMDKWYLLFIILPISPRSLWSLRYSRYSRSNIIHVSWLIQCYILPPDTSLGSLCRIWFGRSYRWFVAWWPNIAVWMDVVFRASASRYTCRLLLPCMGRRLLGGVHISALFAGSHTEIFMDPRTGQLMLLMVPVTLEITCFFWLYNSAHQTTQSKYNSRSKSLSCSRSMNSSSSS
jgi:hypothetical protein